MSVESQLTRVTAPRLQQCLENPGQVWDTLADELDDVVLLDQYAENPTARTIMISEHDLSMLAHLNYGDTVLERALLTGQHVLGKGPLAYMTPAEVRETAAALRRVTGAELRARFDMYPDGIEAWIGTAYGGRYPTEAALLAYQKTRFDLIVAFYDRAAAGQSETGGDAVIIRCG